MKKLMYNNVVSDISFTTYTCYCIYLHIL